MDNTVSIILRTKDRYLMLERALDDILNQTYRNWKIILVNDGGNYEKIFSIVESRKTRINNRINIINLDENKGLNVAINKGAKNVNTEFVVVHDDDDTWDRIFLEECVSYLNKNDCMGVIAHTNLIYEKIEGNKIKTKRIKPFNYNLEGIIPINQMLQHNQFPPISFVYRSEVYNEIGFYDENLKVLEDWDFYIRFILKYDIGVIEKPLANYHLRESEKNNSLSNTVIDRKKEHLKYSNIIKNKLIRGYIDNDNRLGLLIGIYSGQEYNGIKMLVRRIISKLNITI